ncbi:hypothetical protein [Flavobacterium ginsenosidimutans]|uniref:hypothetical protein n=1 Tax=Flavobacterium ginsenosidimutans TaxID=687844 RepID=UPI000DAD84F0|nr:hypothetical protein [Flavobacterium ginsenosidimutans]KAF2338830.1 hypothetical protein DM444_00940 [Flavobacterium ginsenosidimutans]
MKNRATDERRRITRGKTFVNLQAEKQGVRFCEGERGICDAEEKTKTNEGKLTVEELRRCRGFEEISESEGNEIIESLFQLAVIVYNFKM